MCDVTKHSKYLAFGREIIQGWRYFSLRAPEPLAGC
jgi:hypothetical protein